MGSDDYAKAIDDFERRRRRRADRAPAAGEKPS